MVKLCGKKANERNHQMKDALTESRKWYKETLAKKTLVSLEKNNISGCYVETAEKAREEVMRQIPAGSTVGYGGSLTLDQLGVKDILRQGDYEFLDRQNPNLSENEINILRRESLFADVFLMSTNALTAEGQLVNIDGIGNRVAALIYGPARVMVVAGINKIVPDLEAAISRIKNSVAPIHAKRRDKKLPCAKTGHCVDCHAPERFCNALVIIEHQYLKNKERINVMIVGEELGL